MCTARWTPSLSETVQILRKGVRKGTREDQMIAEMECQRNVACDDEIQAERGPRCALMMSTKRWETRRYESVGSA